MRVAVTVLVRVLVPVPVPVLVLERLRPGGKAKVSVRAGVRVAVDATTVPMKDAVHGGTVAAPRGSLRARTDCSPPRNTIVPWRETIG